MHVNCNCQSGLQNGRATRCSYQSYSTASHAYLIAYMFPRQIMAGKSIEDIKREAAVFLQQQAMGGAAEAAAMSGGGEMAAAGALMGEVSSGFVGFG